MGELPGRSLSAAALVQAPDADASAGAPKLLVVALRHERVLLACLRRFTRNEADAEDLLYDTYERLLKTTLPGPQEPLAAKSYLIKVATNVARDWLRHKSVVSTDLLADMSELNLLDDRQLVDEIVSTEQEIALLRAVVRKLPKRMGQVFTLRKVYDMPQRDIAQRLGISENTVEQLLRKAVRKCTEMMDMQVCGDRSS